MHSNRSYTGNRLLDFLSDDDFSEVFDLLELADLPRLTALSQANETDGHSYFLETGVTSIIAISPRGRRAKVGSVGRDGMTPSGLMIDAGLSPFPVIMQTAGKAYRIHSKILARVLRERPTFLMLLTRWTRWPATSCRTASADFAVKVANDGGKEIYRAGPHFNAKTEDDIDREDRHLGAPCDASRIAATSARSCYDIGSARDRAGRQDIRMRSASAPRRIR